MMNREFRFRRVPAFVLVLSVALAALVSGCGKNERRMREEAESYLKANRGLVVSVANGRAMVGTLIAARANPEHEFAALFGDAIAALEGKDVVIRGSLAHKPEYGIGAGISGLLNVKKTLNAEVTVGYVRQQPVNVICHVADAFHEELRGMEAGQPVVFRGKPAVGFLTSLVMTDCVRMCPCEYDAAASVLPRVNAMIADELVSVAEPFDAAPDAVRRELTEMGRCAAFAYPGVEFPDGYWPLTRAEWGRIAKETGYADEIYQDNGFVIIGNGLRGRLAHGPGGRLVVSWSGCDIGVSDRMSDGLSDFLTCLKQVVAGEQEVQFRQALRISAAAAKLTADETWIVGHSLGGCLTTYVALNLSSEFDRVRCGTFNALGVSQLKSLSDSERRKLAAKRLANVYCTRDPVYTTHRLIPLRGLAPQHLGRSYFLEFDLPSGEGKSETDRLFCELSSCHGIDELVRQMSLR